MRYVPIVIRIRKRYKIRVANGAVMKAKDWCEQEARRIGDARVSESNGFVWVERPADKVILNVSQQQ